MLWLGLRLLEQLAIDQVLDDLFSKLLERNVRDDVPAAFTHAPYTQLGVSAKSEQRVGWLMPGAGRYVFMSISVDP